MASKDRGAELPRRIRGAAWTGAVSPAAPELSPALRQRMQAAVQAERADALAREQQRAAGNRTAEPPRRTPRSEPAASQEAGPETSSPGNRASGERTGAAAAVPASPERITGPVPGDGDAGWPGSAARSRPAAGPEPAAGPRTAAEPAPAVPPRPGKPRRRAGARLVALGLAVIVIGSLAAAAIEHSARPPAARPPAARAAVRAQAAAWVADQVSPEATVSCDAVMCAALKAHGFPAGKLVMLGPASRNPVPADVVIETAAVRALFGSSLDTGWAPAVLASFGSGPGAITVRVVARHGAAAYQASLHADLAGRQRSGTALLRQSRITVSATARSQLASGQVDSRLLAALAALGRHQPVDIIQFGNAGSGASPGVPLRFADLAESVPAAHMDAAAYMHAAWAILSTADPRIRPARGISGTFRHQAVLQVQFAAPSPLGTPGPGPSRPRR